MSERGSGKSRKSPASKASASKTSAAKKAARPSRGAAATPARKQKSSARSRDDAGQAALDAPSLLARVIRLESERDRLQSDLEKAQTRIRALEGAREEVVNRIDWVIDSLRNLLDEQQ